jgi:L-alanine-DL-glutamate epimerase-like enolase superfamily enzyme
MKITGVTLHVLENPDVASRALRLERVPHLARIQYTHRAVPDRAPVRQHVLEVTTDHGIASRCTTTMQPHQVETLRNQVSGENPIDRERLYQKLHQGTRWLYQPQGWFGDFDNCLWDIAGKAAGLPVSALIGRARDSLPVYLTGGDGPVADYLRAIERGRKFGVGAYKFHSYKGGKADIPVFREVRREVGTDYALIADPVCSYTLREAIEVGRVMEDLDFVWLEEPFHDQKMTHYQELCRELTIPIISNETLMHDYGLSVQWLIQGATDRLRANARNGTTQVLKLAHFAEGYGTNVELNGQGGLFGIIHAHLGCCIDNTDYYEYFHQTADGNRLQGESWGLLNAPLIEYGHITPPDGSGWGAEWDEARFRHLVVASV